MQTIQKSTKRSALPKPTVEFLLHSVHPLFHVNNCKTEHFISRFYSKHSIHCFGYFFLFCFIFNLIVRSIEEENGVNHEERISSLTGPKKFTDIDSIVYALARKNETLFNTNFSSIIDGEESTFRCIENRRWTGKNENDFATWRASMHCHIISLSHSFFMRPFIQCVHPFPSCFKLTLKSVTSRIFSSS